MKQEPRLVYALNKNGELKHIDEVDNGNSCGCKCPACGDSLIAKNAGKKQRHHFAHASNESCAAGYETSLHLLAKKILSEAKKILLPAVYLKLNNHRLKISEPKEIEIESVELESRLNDGESVIIPDVIITDKKSKRQIFIEIMVTHPVDDKKFEKISKRKKSTIEIDLSTIDITYNDKKVKLEDLLSIAKDNTYAEKELREHILSESEYKYWVYNTIEEKWQNRLREEAINFVTQVFYIHSKVIGCPLRRNFYHGRPYADVLEDCYFECKYCLAIWQNSYDYETNTDGDEHVLCLGHIKKVLDSPEKFENGDFKEFENYYKRKHNRNLKNI